MILKYVAFPVGAGVRLARYNPHILQSLKRGGVRFVAFEANCEQAARTFADLWGGLS